MGKARTIGPQQLEGLAERYEKAFQESAGVQLNNFLPPPGDPLRATALHRLIRADLELRWRAGQQVYLEDYLERFPELGTAWTLPARLIFEEYRVRQVYGDMPRLETFQKRFPDQFAEFQRLLQEQPILTIVPEATPSRQLPAMAAAPTPLAPGGNDVLAVVGGYHLVNRIGHGTFGEVWRAEAPGGVEVAIKMIIRPLDNEEAQRELQALELIERLRHPFLLSTQAYWPLQDRLLIVMELAEGSLRDRLKECRQQGLAGIPVAELLTYMRESAEALDYLRSVHVLHRDIKPENILLLKRHAKVADFGLARMQESQRLINATSCGTPGYMPPELWRGQISEHSDQYSLAATYAELRLGRRLYPGNALMEIMRQHLEADPDLEPLGEAEQQVLRRALAKEASQRYPSCCEFAEALEQALGKELGRIAPVVEEAGTDDATEKETPAVPARPRFWQAAVLLLAVVAAVGLFGSYWLYTHQPPSDSSGEQPVVIVAQPEVVMPPKCEPGPDSPTVDLDGKRYYTQIVCIPQDGARVEFLLIPKRPGTDDPNTFYIMRDKVWVELFRKFDEANPQSVKMDSWKKGGLAGDKPTNNANERHPVLNVFVEDAWRFARWLGGNLPTTRQWDTAAGRYLENPRDGPFAGPWNPNDKTAIAVNRFKEGPMEVGTARQDVSPFGCRDMSGNGEEWTRNVTRLDLDLTVPLANPKKEDDGVFLRGWSYGHRVPFSFKDLPESPGAKRYPDTDPEVGFRVVIEP